MSVIILGLFSENKYFKSEDFLKDMKFERFMVSKHYDEIVLTDTQMYRLLDLKDFFTKVYSVVKTIDLAIEPQVNSGYRSFKINKLVGGSPSSQHPDFKALDISFWRGNVQITGLELRGLCMEINKVIGNSILQLICYETFIHMSLYDADRPDIKRLRKGI